ncbi:MAG: DNA polymerase I [Thermoleophilia bacterium]
MTEISAKHRLFLVDGSSLAYRAFFALPESIATRQGFPTNALYGFSQMMLKIVTEYEPATVVVAWDAREKTFRHEEFADYKAQRPHMPDSLSQQWPHLEELVAAFGFVNLKLAGYEADDILGTLAEYAKAMTISSVVVTGDRDALQVVDDCIAVMTTGRGVTDVKLYAPQQVVERYGITPDKVPDFIGLKGDTSDNIPGVPGIGEKTAAALLQQFGSMEALYERLDEVGSEKRRSLLKEHEETARLSKRLATMVLDVPLSEDLDELVRRGGYRLPVADVEQVFTRFEFATLARRVHELGAGGRAEAAVGTSASVAEGPADGVAFAAAARVDAGPLTLPTVVAEEGLGPLAAMLEQKETALAVMNLAAGETLAAVYDGGAVALTTHIAEDRWRSLWRLAAHVIAHDAKAFPGFTAAPVGPAFDTAVAAYLLAPEQPARDLYRLVAIDEAEVAALPTAAAQVAARAVLTWRLSRQQEPRLENDELGRLFREIELPLVRVLALMEAAGVKMDPYRLGEITARVRDRIDELRDSIYELAGGGFSIGSPQQLAEVLFGRLGLTPARKGKTGFSTDARVLKGLRGAHAIVPAVEEWRELTKLLNTYLEPLPAHLDPATGRLHTTFNQMVTATGRLSSSNPNLQNIPVRSDLGSEIRACFVAESGCKLVVADYSQIELRLMAYLAQEPALLDAYRRGEDVHRVTAAAVAGIPAEEVTKQQREHAKATNFGIMYGLSPYGLSEQVDISVDEARAFISAYFDKYPRVAEFRQRTIAAATEDGYVTTLFGRRRSLPELHASSHSVRALGERLAVNTVLQGTAADIIKVAMVRLQQALDDHRLVARLVLQVHDELVLECPAAEVEQALPLLRTAMCDAFVMDPALTVAVGVGDNWVDAK